MLNACPVWRRFCRFPSNVADNDRSTRSVAEFSSKWRTRFSHLRGGSYNHTVMQMMWTTFADLVNGRSDAPAVRPGVTHGYLRRS
jgi:hypothetical protein